MVEVILTGFMGSGKTTIGKLLAAAVRRDHLDLDDLITSYTAASINQLFAERGEGYFRAVETEMLAAALDRPGILSTGGGTVAAAANRRLLKAAAAPVIYLRTSFTAIQDRLSGDDSRPLIRSSPQALRALYHARLHDYEQAADLIVVTDHRSPRQIADEIRRKIGL